MVHVSGHAGIPFESASEDGVEEDAGDTGVIPEIDDATVFTPKKLPLVLEDVVGPGKNRFWRKTAVETDANLVFDSNVSFAHADLFDGNSETSIISGGAQNSFYLSDFPISRKPPYGDAKIVGTDFFFRVKKDGIDTTSTMRGISPQYKFYMVEDSIGAGNEGTITPYPTGQYPDSPLAAFCSYFDDSATWLDEDFSDGGKSTVINGTVVKAADAYLPFLWAQDNTESGFYGGDNSDAGLSATYFEDKFRTRYVSTLSNGKEVIYVAKEGIEWGPWDAHWKPTKGTGPMRDDPTWHAEDVRKAGLPHYAYETQAEITINPPANTENTFFDSIWQYDSTKMYDDDGVSLALGSQITFDASNSKAGGSALKMEASWHTLYSGTLGWSARTKKGLETATATKKGENNNRTISIGFRQNSPATTVRSIETKTWIPHRISAVAVKELPLPLIHSASSMGLDWTGSTGSIKLDSDEDGYTGLDSTITSSEVSIDINVDAMSPAPLFAGGEKTWVNEGDKSGYEFIGMDPRSFCIMFGTRAPRSTETFFDYFCNTRGSPWIWNGKGTAAIGAGSPGANGDRDGLSTGVIINRPSYTDYVDSDGNKIEARGKDGPGNRKSNGVAQFSGSDVGYPFGEDGLMLLPLISRNYNGYANYVNGRSTVYSSGGLKNPWSVFGISKGGRSTDEDDDEYYGTNYGKGQPHPAKVGSQYAVFIGHNASKENLEQYDVPIPMGSWMTIRFILNGHDNDKIYIQVEEAGTGKVLGRTYCNYPFERTIWSDAPPLVMSLWCNGFPMTYNEDNEGDTAQFGWGESKSQSQIQDTSTVVYIDKIELKNFNMTHSNATVSENNPSRGSLYIKANPIMNKELIRTVTPTYLSFGFENVSDIDGNPTYLLFNNFSNSESLPTQLGQSYIRGTASMAGYGDGFVEYLGLGKFLEVSYDSGGNEKNFTSIRSPFVGYATGTLGRTLRGLTINSGVGSTKMAWWNGSSATIQADSATAKGRVEMDGNTADVENFSSKGLMGFDYDGGDAVTEITTTDGPVIMDYRISKRENQWVSARITDYDIEANTITVDDPRIFNLKDGIQYRVYRRENPVVFARNYLDYYVDRKNIKGNTIKLIGDMPVGENQLFNRGWNPTGAWTQGESTLWISPKLAWVVLEVLPFDTGDDSVEDRSYGSVIEVNRGNTSFPSTSDFGVTFNETTYNDGIRQNSRSLDFGSQTSAIKLDTDFGFGGFDTESLSGGELSRVSITKHNRWYVAHMNGAIDEGGLGEGDVLTTLLAPSQESSTTKTTMYTTESTAKTTSSRGTGNYGHYNGVFRPFLLTTFEDELPIVEKFNVSPDEERPFNPKFTWTCKDSDIWYGFLIVDDEYIHHQYHKSSLHMPLNRAKTSNVSPINPSLWYSHAIKDKGDLSMNLADEELARDPEGLAGWCHRFTNPNGEEGVGVSWANMLTKTDISTANAMLPTTEMSLVMHIIPDYQVMPTATKQMLFDNGGGSGNLDGYGGTSTFFKLYIDENGYAGVDICPDNCIEDANGNVVTGSNSRAILTSKTIIPMDGVTPTNIIVTLDASLKRNNLKLFINGKLEDTTGRAYVSGSTSFATSDRWPFNTKIASPIMKNHLAMLGNVTSYYDSTVPEPYRGRMEEVVYYPICIYPVDVISGEYIFDKPLRELSATNKSKSYSAKLFVKDYHNIRGTTVSDVTSTTNVSWRKSVPLFTGESS